MTIAQLMAILADVPNGSAPIIRGRITPDIFVSIPVEQPIPANWERCNEPRGYYPDDVKRIRYTGSTL